MRDMEIADVRNQAGDNTRVTRAVADPNLKPVPLLRGSSRDNVLALQRLAGNRTVIALLQRQTMEPSVQRCGPIPCDCDSEEREKADRTSHEVDQPASTLG
jgi:hypothetical protein